MSKAKDASTVAISSDGRSATVTGKQFEDLANGKIPMFDDLPPIMQLFKASIEYIDHGDVIKEILYTRATSFRLAYEQLLATVYFTKKYAKFVVMTEINGVWIE
jgi:hypothetical protein